MACMPDKAGGLVACRECWSNSRVQGDEMEIPKRLEVSLMKTEGQT